MHYVLLITAITSGAISLAGCVNSQQTYLADGQQGHVISCTPGWTGGVVGAMANASTSWGLVIRRPAKFVVPQGMTSFSKLAKAVSMAKRGKAADLSPRRTTA
jgi:hypothetical protein